MALAGRARRGDREAFSLIYAHHRDGVERCVRRRVSDPELVSDLVSETFTRALASVGRFRWQGGGVRAWLLTIARNLVSDHYRAARTRREVPVPVVPDLSATACPSVEDEVLTRWEHTRVRDAVVCLTARKQEVIAMRFWYGMPGQQVASATGATVGAVKALQRRATQDLRRTLGRCDTRGVSFA
ncbi:RNA polymerase sigma factor [Streptomyces sp. NPDC057253]|uniref:RNA polymerase sigma factor n=1 Tax=Streptomyces sp. NPDC057253 TaxID=3346069 RepID=UPI003629677D